MLRAWHRHTPRLPSRGRKHGSIIRHLVLYDETQILLKKVMTNCNSKLQINIMMDSRANVLAGNFGTEPEQSVCFLSGDFFVFEVTGSLLTLSYTIVLLVANHKV